MKLRVTLRGDSTSELTRNLDAHELNPKPIVDVVAGAYVKQYLGKPSLSSTNATKIYFDLDIPEVLHVRERSSHRTFFMQQSQFMIASTLFVTPGITIEECFLFRVPYLPQKLM